VEAIAFMLDQVRGISRIPRTKAAACRCPGHEIRDRLGAPIGRDQRLDVLGETRRRPPVPLVDHEGRLEQRHFSTPIPRAAASNARTAPDELPNRNADPPTSLTSASMSSTSRSTSNGWVSPLAPLPRRS